MMPWLAKFLAGRKSDADFNNPKEWSWLQRRIFPRTYESTVMCFEVKKDDGEPPEIISMTVEKGSLSLMANHPNIAFLIGKLSKMFLDSGAENYLEMQLASPAHPDGFTITIQKRDKKTPHELRREAEFKCIELQSEIDRLNEQNRSLPHVLNRSL